jgi:hypothetical protein
MPVLLEPHGELRGEDVGEIAQAVLFVLKLYCSLSWVCAVNR